MSANRQVEDDLPALDIRAAFDFLGYGLKATMRQKLRVGTTLVVFVLFAALYLTLSPKTYAVTTRILAEPDSIVTRVTGDRSAETMEASRRARELVRARSNLSALIDEVQLIERWNETRSPIGKMLDGVRESMRGPMTQAMMRNALIDMLRERLWVNIDGDVVAMTINWSDPDVAVEIAEVAQKRFLASRENRQIAEIQETINALERALNAQAADVETAGEMLRDTFSARKQNRRSTASKRGGPKVDPELQRIRGDQGRLVEEIDKIESAYQVRRAAAQNRLKDLQSSLGPRHPDVISAVRELDQVSRPPRQLQRLKTELAGLKADGRSVEERKKSDSKTAEVERVIRSNVNIADPEVEAMVDEYKMKKRDLDGLRSRRDKSQLELDTAKIAFAYRYIVTLPALRPREALKPKPAKVIIASLILGLLLGITFAVWRDMRSGTIYEAWQVERLLNIPVVGNIRQSR